MDIYRSENERNTFHAPRQTVDTDASVIIPLLLLLMTEKADKMLLFALLYILM
ncbi:MAG: hypothetical protein IJB86_06430 [Clostridia bacterium]|nr:hypothetical protein [Clostridia bacterium]MBQ7054890.1 hypothetical protein [Oscillospiraceae bacterium]